MPSFKRHVNIFIIYAHRDRETVHDLYVRLARDGFKPWLDAKKLLPGQNWEYEICKAILKSNVVIVCLSQQFDEQRGFRHEELKIALKKAEVLPIEDIFIIPVRLEKCNMPDSLHHLHRVDLFETDGYKKLIHALRKCEESI